MKLRDRLLTAVLNPPALLYILLCCAWPNVAWPQTPAPRITPIPESVLPIDNEGFDAWCKARHQGRVEHLISTPQGLYVGCKGEARGRSWLWTKVGVPAIEVPALPGLT